MAESLGIMDNDFKDWPFILRTIKYSFTPDVIGSTGAQLHSDTGFITLLQDDEHVSGLEMMDDFGSFKAVPPIPGAFLCIVGDVGHVSIDYQNTLILMSLMSLWTLPKCLVRLSKGVSKSLE